MRVPLSWLREYVAIDASLQDLASRLTLAGVAVDRIERSGSGWAHVYVGEIVGLEQHPNADRLRLAQVRYGPETVTVVTGAPNLSVGDRVPFALVGAELIDMHQTPPRLARLRPSKIRGVESRGMVCSAAELGLGDDHDGILILDPTTPVGVALADVLGETVLELDLTPNRSDCLSMLGVAREVSALTEQPYREPMLDAVGSGAPAAERLSIEIADPELCRRYVGALIDDVTIGPSPAWMQERLTAAGVRPINNIVDITNYVMLEFGQPLHAFDFAQVRGERIVVRRARPEESIRTLDGVDRRLVADTLVIADAERPVAIAGVMGGEESEVSPATRTILLESACFNPATVRRTARSLKLPSEAARRFEKGLPPELTVPALARAAQLIGELAGGVIAAGWVDSYPEPHGPRVVDVPLSEIERLLGVAIPAEEAIAILARLGFAAERIGEALHVTVPFRRVDVAIPADVVEEIARVRGYDTLPSTLLAGRVPVPSPRLSPWAIEEDLRDILVGCGLDEIITYSLIGRARLERLHGAVGDDPIAQEVVDRITPTNEPLRLVNPLSTELELLRTSALPQMIEALRSNLRWVDRDVALFEIGRIYLARPGDLPDERRVLTIGMGQYRSDRAWGSRVAVDFFDLKGVVEAIFDRVGIEDVDYVPVAHAAFRPGHCAAVVRQRRQSKQREVLGVLGEIDRSIGRAYGLDEPAFLAGLDLDRIGALVSGTTPVRPLARYPAVYQDLALIVPSSVPAIDVRRAILRAGRPLAVDVELFDVYQGDRIPAGARSLGYRITYQAPERTLNDREVAEAHARIEAAVQRTFGAQVRGRG